MKEYSGHRQRLKQRFLNAGRAGMSDHELLELLLCFSIPRRDVKGIAKTLLARFGSLYAVLAADVEQLQLTKGIGENSAVLLKLFHVLKKECEHPVSPAGQILDNPAAVRDYLVERFKSAGKEELLVLMLDNEFSLVDSFSFTGGIRAVLFTPADFMYRILSCRSVKQVILIHNHPGKTHNSSVSDINSTIQIRKLLSMLGVSLADHLIVFGDKISSLLKHDPSHYFNGDSSTQKSVHHPPSE